MILLIRKTILPQAAQTWWRFLNVYETYPYSLLQLVDAAVDEEKRDETAKGVYDLPACCVASDLFSSRASVMGA